jgi:deoxyribose-phosphate aldolase
LLNTIVGVTTVIGFPLGASSTESKVFETTQAIKDGSDEIDMVINIGALKSKNYSVVLNDMKAVKAAAKDKIVKCIMENCLLSKDEIIKACELAIEAGLDYVKTSTGFNTSGATIEDVELMAKVVKNKALVKAAGGVRNYEDAVAMIKAGANRLGTSGGVAIVKGKQHNETY